MNLLIIVPCYNEGKRIKSNDFISFGKNNANIHFLFVDDGSIDNTSAIIKEICVQLKESSTLILNKNVGKAEAIRNGVLYLNEKTTEYDFIGYLDADLSVKLEELNNFIDVINKKKTIKFIMGSRVNLLGSDINRTWKRHYLGRLFATVVSLLFNKKIYDTQCGLKLIDASLVTELFQEKFISKWLFDIELIIRWGIIFPTYNEKIIEHPLESWHDISGSKLKLRNFINAPLEILLIWKKYHAFIK